MSRNSRKDRALKKKRRRRLEKWRRDKLIRELRQRMSFVTRDLIRSRMQEASFTRNILPPRFNPLCNDWPDTFIGWSRLLNPPYDATRDTFRFEVASTPRYFFEASYVDEAADNLEDTSHEGEEDYE